MTHLVTYGPLRNIDNSSERGLYFEPISQLLTPGQEWLSSYIKVGIVDQLQIRQKILDFQALEEFVATDNLVGYGFFLQSNFYEPGQRIVADC